MVDGIETDDATEGPVVVRGGGTGVPARRALAFGEVEG